MVTKIEWADRVWNPVAGCTPISEGCQNCYAQRMSKRLAGRCGYPKEKPFAVVKHDDVFIQPLKWRKPTRVFVGSMGDLFHAEVEGRWIDGVFATMGLTYDGIANSENVAETYRQRHTYMLLTKRPERMRDYIQALIELDWEALWKRFYHISMGLCDLRAKAPYMAHMNASMVVATWIKNGMPGLWLGVTTENQQRADERIPVLLQIPAAKRFVSIEPMLGPLTLTNMDAEMAGHENLYFINALTGKHDDMGRPCNQLNKLDWVICGGETGPGARPIHPDWVRSLRDQCQAAGVPFFFKSWGDWGVVPFSTPIGERVFGCWRNQRFSWGEQWNEEEYPGVTNMIRIGKKNAGHLLDGREWNEFPEVSV